MGGAEVAAPEAGDAEVHPHRVYDAVDHPEHTHGTHLEADPVVAAELPVDVHLDGNGGGGRDLQIQSHLFRMRQDPGRNRGITRYPPVFRYKNNSLFSGESPAAASGRGDKLNNERQSGGFLVMTELPGTFRHGYVLIIFYHAFFI